MADNGISTLATKELRQKAKLDLAAAKRAADGNPRATYDLTLLPTQYDDNNIVDNPNNEGLILGRPWVDTPVVSYAVVPRQLTVDEGLGNGSVFDITTTGIPDGTTLYFTVTGTVTGADFNGGTLPSGSTVVTNNASAVSFGLIEDSLTEGEENYALQLRTGSTSGPVVATSAFVTVNDTSTTPDVVTRNLQLYLSAADTNSYSGTGTVWTDLSTNEYATALISAPVFNNTHFTFDGVNDYVDTNQSLASESFSVGVWFRTSATGINMMLSKEVTTGRPWNYRLWLNDGELRGDMGQGTSTAELIFDGGYNDGEWYFGMFTRDDNSWYLYVNGIEVATRSDPLTGTVSNNQELWIGRSAFTAGGLNPTGSYPYSGDIGQVFVYNTVLTPTEILQNYNATKAIYGL